MGQEARACARDLAVLVENTALQAQVEVDLIHCSPAHDGDLVVPVVPALPVAVAMVACAKECAVMGIH